MDKLSLAKLKVSTIMTKNLITATSDVTVEVAVKRMIDNDVECLPIVNAKDELCGYSFLGLLGVVPMDPR